jgi:tRNA 2-thiocytidine biosynthesis protein TtcA
MARLSREVNRLVGKAIHRYSMLADGDRILVAVSGGSDSMLCLWFLRHWLRKAPISYCLFPVYLDMGFGSEAWDTLDRYIQSIKLPFHREETDYGLAAHDDRNLGKSPCFVCAMKRRRRLFELADIMGCNKIALGHNLDDLIETFFINILYAGETGTMHPCQEMFRGKITIIRPLALVEKKKVAALAGKLRLPEVENPCPSSGKSKRTEIRQWIEKLSEADPAIRGNVRRAMGRIRSDYLL